MLSATSRAASSGTVMLARCGVINTVSMPQNGWPAGSGSTVKASSVASATAPERSAAISAGSSMMARRVHQARPARKQSEAARIEQTARLRRQRQHDDEDVSLGEEAVERFGAGRAAHASDRPGRPRPAAHVEARTRQLGGGGAAELAEAQYADAEGRERARVDVVPLAPALRALEGADVASVADDGEEHVARHQLDHAAVGEPRDRHLRQVAAAHQRVDARAKVDDQGEVAEGREEAGRRLPGEHIAHVCGIADVGRDAEVQVGQLGAEHAPPSDGIVVLAVENESLAHPQGAPPSIRVMAVMASS
jgi:hypothetical protein